MEEHRLLGHNCRDGNVNSNKDWITTCSCNAKWSQPANSTLEHLNSIFESHVKYSKHELIKPL